MRQNDDRKLDVYLKNKKYTNKLKDIKKLYILNKIYGATINDMWSPGLIHLKSEEDIRNTVADMEDQWEYKVPLFHDWLSTRSLIKEKPTCVSL